MDEAKPTIESRGEESISDSEKRNRIIRRKKSKSTTASPRLISSPIVMPTMLSMTRNSSISSISPSSTSATQSLKTDHKKNQVEPFPKSNNSTDDKSDLTQRDERELVSHGILTRLIENLRIKCVNEAEARVILVRRAETISDIFPDWVNEAFTRDGNYVPFDLNMPSVLRRRKRFRDFSIDPPLTNLGKHFSHQFGQSIESDAPILILTAPQVADIQTGIRIVEGIACGVGWNIEPGLAGYIPIGTSCPQLELNLAYETVMSVDYVNSILGTETIEAFHSRIEKVISKINFISGTSTMLVVEASVIDAILQVKMRNNESLTEEKRANVVGSLPCLSMLHFDISEDGTWKCSAASLPGLTSKCPTLMNEPEINSLIRPNLYKNPFVST